jgi:glycosidase
MQNWIGTTVWWHVYPLGFVGAEREANAGGNVVHRLDHLTAWLEYAVNLGASGLLLGPIFASSTHGYDTIDYFRIDPRLGDLADFDAFIDGARSRGLRVVLDGVFNHVGRDFPIFKRALLGGPTSDDSRWFRFVWPPEDRADEPPDYATFEGHRHLVALNHDEPMVIDYVTKVMSYWLDRGIDGWRLDAAYSVPREFWRKVLPNVRSGYPGAYIFGEVIHGDHVTFVRETGVDAVTQYELWKAIWSSLNDRNLFELSWALKRHDAMLDHFVPQTFIGNHDVTRIASQLNDERHLCHALVILLTLGGCPSIYSGDEQAFRGVKEHRAGGDDVIRPPFPATPAGLAPFGWPIYRLHQMLIGLRRRHPWMHRARIHILEVRNTNLSIAVSDAENRLWILLNVADDPVTQTIDAKARCIAGDAAALQKDRLTEITVPGHGWCILEPHQLN